MRDRESEGANTPGRFGEAAGLRDDVVRVFGLGIFATLRVSAAGERVVQSTG